jgi:hypothetical protein
VDIGVKKGKVSLNVYVCVGSEVHINLLLLTTIFFFDSSWLHCHSWLTVSFWVVHAMFSSSHLSTICPQPCIAFLNISLIFFYLKQATFLLTRNKLSLSCCRWVWTFTLLPTTLSRVLSNRNSNLFQIEYIFSFLK